jgi:Bacterial Ig-like domain (group 3)/Glucodextranase, domain B
MRISRIVAAFALICSVVNLAHAISIEEKLGPRRSKASQSVEANAPSTDAIQFSRLPIYFEPNHGQSHPSVEFIGRGTGYQVFIKADETILVFSRPKQLGVGMAGDIDPAKRLMQVERAPVEIEQAVVRIRYQNTHANSRLAAADPLPGRSNYFYGNDPAQWRTDIPHYATVVQKNLYPGIDKVIYGNGSSGSGSEGGKLEYDLEIQPGADPSQINQVIEGADSLRVDEAGDLIIQTKLGEIRQQRPKAYQTNGSKFDEVEGNFELARDGSVRFNVGQYDKTKLLVIDPVLSYAAILGGQSNLGAIAVDSTGNTFAVGCATGTDLPVVGGLGNGLTSGIFISKLNSAGSALVYATYLGGMTDTTCPFIAPTASRRMAIAVNSAGAAFVTGVAGTGLPAVSAFRATPPASGSGVFVVKLAPAGNALNYSTFLGTGEVRAIAINSSGNAIVAGTTAATDFPTSTGAFQTTNRALGGEQNAFITKLSPTGNTLVFSTYFGGQRVSLTNGIALDASGNVIFGGSDGIADPVSTVKLPILNATQTLPGSYACRKNFQALVCENRSFLAKLNATGKTLAFSTYVGGNTGFRPTDVALNAAGQIFLAGIVDLTALKDSNPSQALLSGEDDMVLMKLAADGRSTLFTKALGGNGSDFPNRLVIDANGDAVIVGDTSSSTLPVVNALQSQSNARPGDASLGLQGTYSPFVTRIKGDGTATSFLSYFGGLGYELASGVATDSAGAIYVGGHTGNSLQIPVTPGALKGTGRAFIAKILPLSNVITLTSSASPLKFTDFATIKATVAGTNPTGTIAFYTDGALTATVPLSAGVATTGFGGTFFLASSIRSYYITATYSGDANNASANSSILVQQVIKADSATTLEVLRTNPSVSNKVRLVARVTGFQSSGNVKFLDGTTVLCAAVRVAFGSASCEVVLATGAHTFKAQYLGSDKESPSDSPVVSLTLPWPNLPPSNVTLQSPAITKVSASTANIVLTASGQDLDGTLAKVEYFNGATKIADAPLTSPFSYAWNGVGVGTYNVTVKMTDNEGASTTSAIVVVKVYTPPTVTINAPANGARFATSSNVELTATIGSPGNALAQISFVNTATNTVLQAINAPNPAGGAFTYFWPALPEGAYRFLVRAKDAVGQTTDSSEVNFTVGPLIPAVTITTPANNTNFNVPGPVSVSIRLDNFAPGTVSGQLFDGAQLIASWAPTTNITAAFNASFTTTVLGAHVLTAKFTDASNTVTTSAAVTVNAQPAPDVTLTIPSTFYVAPASIDLLSAVTAPTTPAGTTITKVEYFVKASNSALADPVSIAVFTAPPYTFRWRNIGVAAYTFTAKATDSAGRVGVSAPVTVTVGASGSITDTGNINGTTVNDDTLSFSGRINAPPNASVTVNGQLATLTADGQFFVNNLNLVPGANAVDIRVNTPTGPLTNQTVNVTRSATLPNYKFTASPTQGIAPVNATLTIATNDNTALAANQQMKLSCHNPSKDASVGDAQTSLGSYACAYPNPGVYYPSVIIRDQSNAVIYFAVRAVVVNSPYNVIAVVNGVYLTLLDTLKVNNVTGAMTLFAGTAATKYQDAFNLLSADLSTIVDQLGTVKNIQFGEGIAQVTVVRTTGVLEESYVVHLVRGGDGIWRIESM